MEESMTNNYEFRMPAPLQLESVGDILSKWKNFKQKFKIFLSAAGLDRVNEGRKSAILLNCLGEEAQNIYFNVLKKSDENPKYEELLKLFDDYFEPKQNELINTYNFLNRNQEDGESFDQFYVELKRLVKICHFKEEDRMLRDRIVMGIQDKKLQRKLLENGELSLDEAINKCRASELSKEHAKVMQKDTENMQMDVLYKHEKEPQREVKYNSKSFANKNNYNSKFYHCLKCNRDHGPRQCPAFGKVCSNCNKLNHFAAGCRNKAVSSLEKSECNDNSVHDL